MRPTMLLAGSLLLVFTLCAWADNIDIRGEQTRGQGSDGKLRSSPVTLSQSGVILGAQCDGDGFWIEGPGGPFRFANGSQAARFRLARGQYRAFPNLKPGQNHASVRIQIQPQPQLQGLDLSGTWNVIFKGHVRTTLVLKQSGSSVTGTLRTTDGSLGTVTGSFDGQTLNLSRVTGLDTTQYYRVNVSGDRFKGSFHNQGKYPDDGDFDGVREGSNP